MTETVSFALTIVCKWNVMVILFQLVTFLEQVHYHKFLKLIFSYYSENPLFPLKLIFFRTVTLRNDLVPGNKLKEPCHNSSHF